MGPIEYKESRSVKVSFNTGSTIVHVPSSGSGIKDSGGLSASCWLFPDLVSLMGAILCCFLPCSFSYSLCSRMRCMSHRFRRFSSCSGFAWRFAKISSSRFWVSRKEQFISLNSWKVTSLSEHALFLVHLGPIYTKWKRRSSKNERAKKIKENFRCRSVWTQL